MAIFEGVGLKLVTAAGGALLLTSCASNQLATYIAKHPVPGACETPPPQNAEAVGCYLNAVQQVGTVSDGPLYWHLHTFPDRRSAEAAAVRGRSAVVETFERVWLYTLTRQGWSPAAGKQVAVIGPLVTKPGVPYTVRYMQATFPAGMQTRVHTHSGPEAWYLVSGAQCLRTPDGAIVARAGESAVVPEGPPMILSTVGSETRRAVLMVIHDSRKPWNVEHGAWQPTQSCPAS